MACVGVSITNTHWMYPDRLIGAHPTETVNMHRRTFLAIGAGVTAGLAGCLGDSGRPLPATPDGAWRQPLHNARNTGASDVTVPARGNPAWDRGPGHIAAPVITDGTVFSVADEAAALSARSGSEAWRVDLPSRARYAPALHGDQLVVPTEEALVALAIADGEDRWTTPLPRPAQHAVTVIDDAALVTVPVADTGLIAYDLTDGDERWRDGMYRPRTAAVAEDTIYVTGYKLDGDTSVLRALDVSDGSPRWEEQLDRPHIPPIITNHGILVSDAETLALHNHDEGTRDETLTTFTDRIHEAPAVRDDIAFVPVESGEVAAVSLTDGGIEWRVDAMVTSGTGLSVGRDTVVASLTSLPDTSGAGIAAFNRTDGTVQWEHKLEGFDVYPSTEPVLAEDAIYYTSNASTGVVALGDLDPRDE